MRKEITIIVCDICGQRVEEKDVSGMRIFVPNEDTSVKELNDICNSCAKKINDFIKFEGNVK
jgi:hypothetical protein